MGLIYVKDLQPGMKLRKPVYTPVGALLLTEGRVLTEKHIMLLEAWGILQVDVEGIETVEEAPIELTDEELKEIEKEIDKKFSEFSPDDHIMMEIKLAAKKIKEEEKIEEKRRKKAEEKSDKG